MPERQAANQSSPADGLLPASFGSKARTSVPDRAGALHVCPRCDSELVFPVDWAPAEHKRWNVELRCPDCEWHGGGVYAQEVVDRFDEVLDHGTEQLLADLGLLTRANMEEQLERFVAALWADQIVPEDF